MVEQRKPIVKRIPTDRHLDKKSASSITEKPRSRTVIHVNSGLLKEIKRSHSKQNDNRPRQISTVMTVHRGLRSHQKMNKHLDITKISDQRSTATVNTRHGAHSLTSSKGALAEILISVQKETANNRNDLTIDHHRKSKGYKKRQFSRRCMVLIIVLIIVLILLSITIILLVLLIKPTSKLMSMNLNPVLRWNSTGITVAGITGSSGLSNNQLNTPIDVIVDYKNNLYVADYMNFRVQKYFSGSSTGHTVAGNGTLGSDSHQLNKALRVILDADDNLYVADSNNHRIQYWTKNSQYVKTVAGKTVIPGNATDLLYHPYGLALHSTSGPLYIADYFNHRIMSYEFGVNNGTLIFGGNGAGISTTQLFRPIGLHYDAHTNSLIVANFGAHNIVQYTLDTYTWTLRAGNGSGFSGKTGAELDGPMEAILDPMGNMYVADRNNHRIQFYAVGQSCGITIAGISTVNQSNATTLDMPRSVRLDNQLNLYVADANNHRIQKFLRY